MRLSRRFMIAWALPAVVAGIIWGGFLGSPGAQADPAPDGQCTSYPADAGATGDTGSTGWSGHADAVVQEQELVDQCNALIDASNSLHGDVYVVAGCIVGCFVAYWVLHYFMPS